MSVAPTSGCGQNARRRRRRDQQGRRGVDREIGGDKERIRKGFKGEGGERSQEEENTWIYLKTLRYHQNQAHSKKRIGATKIRREQKAIKFGC